jgi:two-component system OmpR family response regulator
MLCWEVVVVNTPGEETHILLIDDEVPIVDALATCLCYEGFQVSKARTGAQRIEAAKNRPPDLVVLDVMLPDFDGFEVARRLRATGVVAPMFFITTRDSQRYKKAGLAVGDDYVAKPFALAEVVARARAILHRAASGPLPNEPLRFANVVMDEAAREVTRGDAVIDLTATEYSLLRHFLRHPRRVISKMAILENVWHYDFQGNANVVETYVGYLRRKLNAHGPELIHTIRKAGYILRETR